MASDEFRPAKWFVARFGVSTHSLRLWEVNGTIKKKALRCPGGKRLYSVGAVLEALGDGAGDVLEPPPPKTNIAYARVSSAADLDRQVDLLREAFPNHKIVTDVGSGLNFGLRSILDAAHRGLVGEVAVLHKDRLCRFAADLVEYVLGQAGVQLVVHCPSQDPDEFGDLADDFLAVTTFFVASHNGKRSAAHKRERKRKREADKAHDAVTADPMLPNA